MGDEYPTTFFEGELYPETPSAKSQKFRTMFEGIEPT